MNFNKIDKNCLEGICRFLSPYEERNLSAANHRFRIVLSSDWHTLNRMEKAIENVPLETFSVAQRERFQNHFFQIFKRMKANNIKLIRPLPKEEMNALFEKRIAHFISIAKKGVERNLNGHFILMEEQKINPYFIRALVKSLHKKNTKNEIAHIERLFSINPSLRGDVFFFKSAIKKRNFRILNRMQINGSVEEKLDLFAWTVNTLGKEKYRKSRRVFASLVLVFFSGLRTLFQDRLEQIIAVHKENLNRKIEGDCKDIYDRLIDRIEKGKIPYQMFDFSLPHTCDRIFNWTLGM